MTISRLLMGSGPKKYWQTTFAGTSYEEPNAIQLDASLNIYLVGLTTSSGAGAADGLFAKFAPSGGIQWQRTLGTASFGDYMEDCKLASSGNLYVCGITHYNTTPIGYAYVAQYSSSGALQWQRELSSGTTEVKGLGCAIDASENVYVAGRGKSGGYYYGVLAKYNSSGTLQWQRKLSGTSKSVILDAVECDSSGNVYVCGETTVSSLNTYYAAFVAKYNSAGVIQWQKVLTQSVSGDVQFVAITLDSSSNIYVCGYYVPAYPTVKLILAKYNSSGALQWQRDLGVTGDSFEGQKIALDANNNIFVIGGLYPSGVSYGDVAVVKYNSSGTLQWQQKISTIYDDNSFAIAVDNAGGMIVAFGSSDVNYDLADIIISRLPDDGSYAKTVGVVTYGSASMTGGTPTLTDSTAAATDAAGALTDSAGSQTDAAATLNVSTTYI